MGINPANIGFGGDRVAALGFFQGAYSIHSKALTRADINTAVTSGNSESLTAELRQNYSETFVNEGLSFDFDALLAGVAIEPTDKLAFGVSATLRNIGRVRLNDFASDYFFHGLTFDEYFNTTTDGNGDTIGVAKDAENFYELLEGTYIYGLSVLPISLGGAYTFDQWNSFKIKAGATVKYVMGMATVDFNTSEDLSEAMVSYPPAAPFGIGNSNGESFSPAGSGFGFDLGVSWEYEENLTIAMSLTDVGSINWTENVTRFNSIALDTVSYDGAQNYNFIDEMDRSTDGLGLTEVVDESVSQPLPTKLRLGGLYKPITNLTVAADFIIPLNNAPGNFVSAFAGVGATYQMDSGLKVSSGFSYFQDNGFSMPLGVGFVFGEDEVYELGIGTRDVASFLSSNNPTISYSLGFLRFKI